MNKLVKQALLSATIITSALGLTACQDGSSDNDISVQQDTIETVKPNNTHEVSPEAILESSMWRDNVRAKLYVVDTPMGESSLIGENTEGVSSAFITKAADNYSNIVRGYFMLKR